VDKTNQKPHISYPTDPEIEMYDPLIFPPPKNAMLLVATEGGICMRSVWYDGCKAWLYLPKVPKSVKQREHEKANVCTGQGHSCSQSQKAPGEYSYLPRDNADAYAPVRFGSVVQQR
jgi:hypothetical protein